MAFAATSHTIRVATGLRSGFDHQQHVPIDARRGRCGEPIREQRYDRPDWPRCLDCLEIDGITVAAPTPAVAPESESELRFAHGDR